MNFSPKFNKAKAIFQFQTVLYTRIKKNMLDLR